MVPLPSAMTYIRKMPRSSACLDTATRASASLVTVPRPRVMTCIGKVPRPSTCLDTVTLPSACLDTIPRPSALICLGKVRHVKTFMMDTTTQDPSPMIEYSKVYSLAYS